MRRVRPPAAPGPSVPEPGMSCAFDLSYLRAWTPTVFVEEDRWEELQELPFQLHRHFEPMLFFRLKQPGVVSKPKNTIRSVDAINTEPTKHPQTTFSGQHFTREKRPISKNLVVKGQAPLKSNKVYTLQSETKQKSFRSIRCEIAKPDQQENPLHRPYSVQSVLRRPHSRNGKSSYQIPIRFGVWEIEVSQGLSRKSATKTRKDSMLTWFTGRPLPESKGQRWSDPWHGKPLIRRDQNSSLWTGGDSSSRFSEQIRNRMIRGTGTNAVGISNDDVDSLFITKRYFPSPHESACRSARRPNSAGKRLHVPDSVRPISVDSAAGTLLADIDGGLQPWSVETATPTLLCKSSKSRSGSAHSTPGPSRKASSGSGSGLKLDQFVDDAGTISRARSIIAPLFDVKVSSIKKGAPECTQALQLDADLLEPRPPS